VKNYYELLSVAADAPADDIRKAFRREIARYHPDKVQHLGAEFQEMASGIAADLTEAYRILMDPESRSRYDATLRGQASTEAGDARGPRPAPAAPPPVSEPAPPPPRETPRPTAGFDFVKRAALARIREAAADVLGDAESATVAGFDLAMVIRAKKSLFRKAEDSICVLVRIVPFVDADTIAQSWVPAARVRVPGADSCTVLLVGQGMAPARDLAAAVTEQRRRSRGAGPLPIPVDVRDWEALFPPETPGAVRSLIQRLKDGKR
jgi:hypothetical protein